METLDLRNEYKFLYRPSAKTPALVEVPPLRFLVIDGMGAPGESDFQDCMQALFTLAYTVRFGAKKHLELEYPVLPPQGSYRRRDGGPLTADTPSEDMKWTLQIPLPEEVPLDFVESMRAEAAEKDEGGPHLGDVEVGEDPGGLHVHMMHIGSYDTESVTVEKLLAFADQSGYIIAGPHTEVYISNPNRSTPEKLKTVLRFAVTRKPDRAQRGA